MHFLGIYNRKRTSFIHSENLGTLAQFFNIIIISGYFSCSLQWNIPVEFLFLVVYWNLERFLKQKKLDFFVLLNKCILGTNVFIIIECWAISGGSRTLVQNMVLNPTESPNEYFWYIWNGMLTYYSEHIHYHTKSRDQIKKNEFQNLFQVPWFINCSNYPWHHLTSMIFFLKSNDEKYIIWK